MTTNGPAPPKGSDLLTHSRMSTFRDCAYKHGVQYEDGWRPAVDHEALRFGSLWHAGMEAWWRKVQAQDAAIRKGDDVRAIVLPDEDLSEAFRSALAALRAVAKDVDPYALVRLEEMLRAYHMQWRYAAMDYAVLSVETPFRCPQINPATGRRSETFELAGKIDVLVRRRADGRLGLIEHKTCGESIGDPADTYWTKLAIDPQLSIYVIGAESLGMQVEFIVYDVARKPEHRPLAPTPPEKLKYRIRRTEEEKTWAENDPRLLYAGARLAPESPDEYRLRVREALGGSVESAENLGKMFVQREAARLESQLRDFLHDAWWTGRMIRELQLAGHVRPRNPAACHRMGTCWLWNHCAFGKPLVDVADGGDFRRVDNVHPELEGAI